jgi:phosphoglycerate dehydrogenase-like enzyme
VFGIPGDSATELTALVRGHPGVRWVQATAAGAGQQVHAAALTPDELSRVAVTSAAGVHAGPLAEFAMLGLLAMVKDLPRLRDDQRARRWEHRPIDELRGRTVLIVGLGAIGREVARLAKAFGMRTLAINRSGMTDSASVDTVAGAAALTTMLAEADALVVTAPLTLETEGMIDARAIACMRSGALVVNVGRGGVIDEPALVAALRDGQVAGAALDVFAAEPLPDESPLWALPNVIVSPHTAALSVRENERIVALFCDNLERYLAGRQLRNRVDPDLFY